MIEKLYEIFKKYPKISTDTRRIEHDSIFFALKGGNFDGNGFAEAALNCGARYAVIDNAAFQKNDRDYFVVDDVLTTLQELSHYHRKQLQAMFIGITGSNGKTTTKELISAVLSSHYDTIATKGNLNNHIGVPLTLLSIDFDKEFAIVEMGANHVGEIEMLSVLCDPGFGIITNIGKAHLEGFGGIEGVITGKTELYNHLERNGGIVFVNADDPLLMEKSNSLARFTYGESIDADIVFDVVSSDPYVSLKWRKKEAIDFNEVNSKIIGNYNLPNLAAAIAFGVYFGVPEEKIKVALENYVSDNNRSQFIKTKSNAVFLDAYNANPKSMLAALNNFNTITGENKIVILGDMLEMGEYSFTEHELILKSVEKSNFDTVILVGKEFKRVNTNSKFLCFSNAEEVKDYFANQPLTGATILVKGSRGIRLETLLPIL